MVVKKLNSMVLIKMIYQPSKLDGRNTSFTSNCSSCKRNRMVHLDLLKKVMLCLDNGLGLVKELNQLELIAIPKQSKI